jgi:protein-S-isoprenylcysteine O-methyltransferase Ste14
VASATAIALLLAGALLMAGSAAKLGDRLTPLPRPARHAVLIESGVYRFVRHPMYSGVALAAFGWAFVCRGWLTLGYAFLLLVFLDIKARREEVWLSERFPGYAGYRRRVKKLVPFVY